MSVLLNDLLNCVNGVIFIVAVSIIWKVPFYIHWDKQRPQSVECMAVADPEIKRGIGGLRIKFLAVSMSKAL